jgi:hypothetical protein
VGSVGTGSRPASEEDDDQTTLRRPRPAVARWTLVAIGVAWLVAAQWTVFPALGELVDWLADQFALAFTTPSFDPQEARRLGAISAVVGTGVASTGLGLALLWRRTAAVVIFAGGAVASLVVGLSLHALGTPDEPPRPAWEDRPRVCQEHSGGDNRCPGG